MKNISVIYSTTFTESYFIKYQTRLPLNITEVTLSNTLFYTDNHKDYILNLSTLESLQISFYLNVQYYENDSHCLYNLNCIKKQLYKTKSIKVFVDYENCKKIVKLLVTFNDNTTKIYV